MYITKHKSFFDVIDPVDPLDDSFPQEPIYSHGVTSRINSNDSDDPAFWGNLCDEFNNYQAEMQTRTNPPTQT